MKRETKVMLATVIPGLIVAYFMVFQGDLIAGLLVSLSGEITNEIMSNHSITK